MDLDTTGSPEPTVGIANHQPTTHTGSKTTMFKKLRCDAKWALATIAAATAMSGSAQAEEVLKLSFFASPKDPTYSDVLLPWMKAINAEGKGVVRIDAFPGSSLVRGPAAQAKAVGDGVADLAWIVPAYTPGRFPDNEVMELPGVFRDVRESSTVFRRLYNRGLLRGYDNYYVPLLVTTHPYAIHTVKPVKTIDDIKGLKLRAGGPVASASMKALGAVPVGMPVPAIAENVSKGVLNGTGAEWNVMYAFKIIEVAKNHYMQRLGTVPLTVLMNGKKYASLSGKARAIIDRHSGEVLTRKFGDVHFAIQGARLKTTMAKPGHTIVNPGEKEVARWNALMQGVTDKWIATHPKGKELFAAVKEELAKLRAK